MIARRIRRLVVWTVYILLPRSPSRGFDEQQASLTLYPTRRRHVELTSRKSPGTVGAARGTAKEERTLDGQHAV